MHSLVQAFYRHNISILVISLILELLGNDTFSQASVVLLLLLKIYNLQYL